MKEVNGIVVDLVSHGLDCPTIVHVKYVVNDKEYIVKETLKLKSEIIKLGFFPIGQRKHPKINCKIGNIVTVEYDEKNPKKSHIKGNDGILNS